ncbi:MAG: [Fe-Fe] hydrogenase large subunit C-terminal domain-containing protein [bacterium]
MKDSNSDLGSLLEDLDEPSLPSSSRFVSEVPKSSVRLDPRMCVGCAACMRVCPTEAIRIRNGKAVIRPQLCIDCGECVRVCEHNAGIILSDPISAIQNFQYRIAVPEASLYGQFIPAILPNDILAGILDLGFHEVFEAALATERASLLLREYMDRYHGPKPLMTSFCPVVLRLIQLRFPDLVDLVIPIDSTLELAIKNLKEERAREKGIPVEKVGAFYLVGCPARITTIHHPYTGGKTHLDGAISVAEIYKDLMFAIRRRQRSGLKPPQLHSSSSLGLRWGTLWGEVEALGLENAIAVSDMKHLVRIMEEIDNHTLTDIEFVECRACYAGCAGGPLMVDNPYRGRSKIQRLCRMFPELSHTKETWARENFEKFQHHFDRRMKPLSVEGLDPDPSRAIEKMAQKAKILESLPGIDCGSCGAPNCKALADDIVRGEATIMYCIFKLRDAFLKQRKKASKKRASQSKSKVLKRKAHPH